MVPFSAIKPLAVDDGQGIVFNVVALEVLIYENVITVECQPNVQLPVVRIQKIGAVSLDCS